MQDDDVKGIKGWVCYQRDSATCNFVYNAVMLSILLVGLRTYTSFSKDCRSIINGSQTFHLDRVHHDPAMKRKRDVVCLFEV